jgi:hypothetical protein
MTLLTFENKYVVASTTAVTTTSATLVDDTQASQTFNLAASRVVLVIYQANNVYGAAMPSSGMQNAINIDTVDKANSWNSGYGSNYPMRNTVFWVGTLAAGSHTIKGRFASMTAGSTATISNRVLLIYIFAGDEFQYVDDATTATTASASFVDDPYAQVTFTPSGACKALVMYNCANSGATESFYGKKAAINVAGTDYGQAEKSSYGADYADSVFTVHALSLSAVSTTVKGRFANAGLAATVTVNRRQLAVLLLADTTLMDVITSTTQVSTTSNSLVDDTQATISRTTTDTRELLVIAMGTKRHNTSSSNYGECYGIKINTNDRANSRGSPYTSLYADSAATAYAEQLAAGSHTVQGRFSNNYGAETAKIDARQVVALWFSVAAAWTKSVTQPVSVLSLPLKQSSRSISQSVSVAVSHVKVSRYRRELLQQAKASTFPTKAMLKFAVQPASAFSILSSVLKAKREYAQTVSVTTSPFKQARKIGAQAVSILLLSVKKPSKPVSQPISISTLATKAPTKLTIQSASVTTLSFKHSKSVCQQPISVLTTKIVETRYRREYAQTISAFTSVIGVKAIIRLLTEYVSVTDLLLPKQVEALRTQPIGVSPIPAVVLSLIREYAQSVSVDAVLFKDAEKIREETVSVIDLLLPKQIEKAAMQPIGVLGLLTYLSQYQRVFTETISVPTFLFKASQIPKTQPATVLPQIFRDVQVPKTQPVTVATTPATLSQFIRLFSQPVSVLTMPTWILELIKLLTQPISVLEIKTTVAQYQRVNTQPITVLSTPTTILELIRTLTQPVTVVTTPFWYRELLKVLAQSVSVDTVLAKAIQKYATEIVKPCVIEMVYVPELGRYILIIDNEIGIIT